VHRFEEIGIRALLINCLPPDHVPGMLPWLRDFTDLPLGVYPNLGYYTADGWSFDRTVHGAEYADMAEHWRDEGAQIVGGCCGTRPEHIAAARERVRDRPPGRRNGRVAPPPADPAGVQAQGVAFWPLAVARELDDLILHLRVNEEAIGLWVLRTTGSADLVEAYDRLLEQHAGHWLVREIRLYLKRTLKRLDVTSRSLFALIEPGSCFTGTLLELALACDRSYMLDGRREGDEAPPATLRMTALNFGAYPMPNGLSRLASRFLAEPGRLDDLKGRLGQDLDAAAAGEAGLVTFTPDDIDWDDEVRIAIEERAAFSPDALTGMEASLRFGGPETLESKIFARLSAWQNWIFQRPNAVGDKGALQVYGTGQRAEFDRRRV
jgi:benzoyl-CoA-dihydrodiol lyase